MFLPFSRSESLSRKEQSKWSAIIYIVDERSDSSSTIRELFFKWEE